MNLNNYLNYKMNNCYFSLQFCVNSNSISNFSNDDITSFKSSSDDSIFCKDGIFEDKTMIIKPLSKDPKEIFNKVYRLQTNIIIEKINYLLISIMDDENVMPYVTKLLNKILINMKYINRIKMERLMTLVKMGINSNCNFEVTKSLSELEYYVDILFSPFRQYFSMEEKHIFKTNIIKTILSGNETVEKLIDGLDLTKSIFPKFSEILLKIIAIDSSKEKIIPILSTFIDKTLLVDSLMNSIDSVERLFRILNNSNSSFKIKFSNICITNFFVEDEIYVYYYGYIDKKIGGSFSIDLIKLRNIIKSNYTYYIFYFVMCCYCLNDKHNIFNIDLKINSEDVPNMFIFLEDKYLSMFKDKIKLPENKTVVHKRIINHLDKFMSIVE